MGLPPQRSSDEEPAKKQKTKKKREKIRFSEMKRFINGLQTLARGTFEDKEY